MRKYSILYQFYLKIIEIDNSWKYISLIYNFNNNSFNIEFDLIEITLIRFNWF